MTKTKPTACLALLLAALWCACDPCPTMRDIHTDRCMAGITASCEWLQLHVEASGACVGL